MSSVWAKVAVVWGLTSVVTGAATMGCSSDDPPGGPGASSGSPPPATRDNAAADAGPDKPVLDPRGPEFVDLGTVGPELDLDVPQGTLGFTFEAESANVLSVRDPSGKEYSAAAHPATAPPDYLDLGRFPSMSHMIDVPAGTWKVTLSNPSVVKVARQRTSDGAFHGGVFDLFVYLPAGVHAEDFLAGAVPGDVVTAATAPTNPVITTYLARLSAEAKRLFDLDRGQVKFVDVEASYLDIASEDGARAATTVAARSGNADLGLHILLTEHLIDENTHGIAPARGGTRFARPENAIVVDVRDMHSPSRPLLDYQSAGFQPGDLFATAALHEAGHLFGLAHTSRQFATAGDDGFTDTPTCPSDTLTSNYRSCPDVTNLMFPAVWTPIDKAILSPHQRKVLQGTTFYRPYAAPSR